MRKKMFVLSTLIINLINVGCAQRVEKHAETKYVDFIKSFKEETKSNVIDFSKIISIKAPMSKEEALRFVYHTDDTAKLYCVAFDYSNEDEKFKGVIGSFLWMPNKCLKVNMGDYSFIMYNSYQCTNNCPDPNKLYDCFLNDNQTNSLTLCIVDKNFNLRDSIIVCKDTYRHDSDLTGLLNPKNGKVFLFHRYADWDKPKNHQAYMYEVDKSTLKFELVNEGDVSKKIDTGDLMNMLELLKWETLFLE